MLVRLAAVALLGTLPVAAPGQPDAPGQPGAPAESDAPAVSPVTGVTLAWTTVEGHRQVLVTWQETGTLRNRVDIVHADGAPFSTGATVEADQPNRSTEDPVLFGDTGQHRMAVHVLDAAGKPVGEPALSPVFDTDRLPAVQLDAVNPRADGTVELRWTPRPPAADTTPGDPLDLPVENPQRAVPIVSNQYAYDHDELSGPITGPSFVVPAEHRPPYLAGLKTLNEWGSTFTVSEVFGTRLAAKVPARVSRGATLTVTGTVEETKRACDMAACWPVEAPEKNRQLQLQSRTGSAAAWQVVATARSGNDGTYRLSVPSPGTRQYRVVAPPVTSGVDGRARAAAVTSPATATSVPPASGSASPSPSPTASNGTGGGGASLPITGAPAGTAAALGALLIALGALLRVAARRRPPTAT
ncbi:hypothetical protein [Jidongwangia harbinensis]|uniref:hypothetical protein n=1 Tax=Jidongwangia harbinensis TaxID=2878561 RepID=UPI001CDA30D5|nr:hypothetical protein [Jidongwangia harbinensis]MCA2214008.1 hypothetical protein [Jidongwangia harbinensis]